MSLPRSEDSVKLITRELMDHLIRQAEESPRRRINFNFHPHLQDNPHRFLNVMLRGTYIAPHRHSRPPKAESFLVLEGELAFFLFEEEGEVREVHRLSSGEGIPRGIDIEPGIWHTLVVLSDHVVCYEVKPGPYDPTEDKEFGSWAPREKEEGWEVYLERLERRADHGS